MASEIQQCYLKAGDQTEHALELFDDARPNLELAVDFFATTLLPHPLGPGERAGRPDLDFAALAASLVDALAYLIHLRLHPTQQIFWFRTQHAAARISNDRKHEAYALGNLGVVYREIGDMHRALDLSTQALVISREIGDRRGESNDLCNLGSVYAALGDAHNAIDYYRQGLAIASDIGDLEAQANHLGNLVSRPVGAFSE